MSGRGRPRTPGVLTPREWEVLELLRQGLSNREIAEALQISLAGAKYHVSEIISKLGVSSREEAAAWQPQRRLALAPLLSLLRDRSVATTSAVQFVSGIVIIAVALIALVAILATRGERSTAASEALIPTTTPTVAPTVEPQPSRFGPYVLGYPGGGGWFVNLEDQVLTLGLQGSLAHGAEVQYVIDEETRFLWASDGRVRLDRSTDGLVPGASTSLYFDEPIDESAVATTPADIVLVGYFKYLDGRIVDVGEDYVDMAINPQLREFAENYVNLDGSEVRVWVDPAAELRDIDGRGELTLGTSLDEVNLRSGRHVAFSGLLAADRSPVALWMQLTD